MKLPDPAAYQRLKFTKQQPLMANGEEMLILLALLQYALRSSQLPEESKHIGRDFAEQLQDRIEHVAPEFTELCKMGWDKQFDNAQLIG